MVFGALALAQLGLIAAHQGRLAVIPTWLLAPALAVWVWRARGPRLVILALLFCWAGDVLGNPALLGVGPIGLFLSVAAYAVANAILLILFVRLGALSAWRTTRGAGLWRAGAAAVCVVAAVVVLAVAWSTLDPALRVVGCVYLLLLCVTAIAAFAVNAWAGIGAALFLGSHLLVVLEVAGLLSGGSTLFRLATLSLYAVGILLIAVGAVRRGRPLSPRAS